MVAFGLVTVHWDKLRALRRQVPWLEQAVERLPSMYNDVIMQIPYGGIFATGFAVGFRFA